MMQVNQDRAERREELVASGSIVELRYQDGKKALSLRAGKMLHLLVKSANGALNQHVKHRIRLSEFQYISHFNYKEIKYVSDEIISTLINVISKNRITTGPILDFTDIDIEKNNGDLIFRFSETMVSIFQIEDRWTILNRKMVLAFESRYALRLFEMISLRCGFGRQSEKFELQDLRSRLGVEQDKLNRFPDFRVKCLDAAVNEVQRVMNMDISYQLIKTGKAVSAIVLVWSEPMSATTAMKSEHKPSKALQPAYVGLITPDEAVPQDRSTKLAFPTRGGILYAEPWVTIVRRHAPKYDVDVVAAAFRDYAIKQGIPLNAGHIEKTFVGFVQSYAERRRNVV